MAYTKQFYECYEHDFILWSSVRKAHDWIFSLVINDLAFNHVVDLGSGMSQEFRRYVRPTLYHAIDLYEGSSAEHNDYRKLPSIPSYARAFVSLFSTEITAPYSENYAFYEKLFVNSANLEKALVSGFYYPDHRDINPIPEEGELVYQTLECLEDVRSRVFTEKRIELAVPSKMFGPNVIEVWKLLERSR